jgi:hypothetical protein
MASGPRALAIAHIATAARKQIRWTGLGAVRVFGQVLAGVESNDLYPGRLVIQPGAGVDFTRARCVGLRLAVDDWIIQGPGRLSLRTARALWVRGADPASPPGELSLFAVKKRVTYVKSVASSTDQPRSRYRRPFHDSRPATR